MTLIIDTSHGGRSGRPPAYLKRHWWATSHASIRCRCKCAYSSTTHTATPTSNAFSLIMVHPPPLSQRAKTPRSLDGMGRPCVTRSKCLVCFINCLSLPHLLLVYLSRKVNTSVKRGRFGKTRALVSNLPSPACDPHTKTKVSSYLQ